MNSMAGFIRSLRELDGFLVARGFKIERGIK